VLAALTFLASTLAAAPVGAPAPSSPAAPEKPPPTHTTDCPGPAPLAAALNALMPGLSPGAPAALPLMLANGGHLGVSTSADGDVRVDLVDAQGDVVLHRVLPAPPRGRPADCPALAETIALIVERYLHDVGYEVPPLPPPAPKPAPPPATTPPATVVVTPPGNVPAPPRALWRLGVAGGARVGDAGGLDTDADLAVGVESSSSAVHLGGRLSGGYAPPQQARWSDKSATLRRVPLRFGLYLGIPLGPGQLEPGLGAGADLLIVSVTGPGAASGAHTAPSGDASLAYLLRLTGPLYLRALSRIALAVPYAFTTLEVAQVWGTPRVYGEAGVELGFAFR
jgi:hypothetical protein